MVDGDNEGIWGVVGEAGLEELVLDHILPVGRPDKKEFLGVKERKKKRDLGGVAGRE